MTKYDELVKALRHCVFGDCADCNYRTNCAGLALEAADAIEELMRRCEQFQYMPPPRWIPVTERLPEKYIGEWLCCTEDGKIMILPYDTPGGGSKECVFYVWDDDGYFYQTFNVTHWMPLPAPPKGEKE